MSFQYILDILNQVYYLTNSSYSSSSYSSFSTIQNFILSISLYFMRSYHSLEDITLYIDIKISFLLVNLIKIYTYIKTCKNLIRKEN